MKTRWWFLGFLQCLAVYVFALGPSSVQQATVASCYRGHASGAGTALEAVVRSLQLPWDEASTVDRCASEAVLDETLGPGWTTEERPASPWSLTSNADAGLFDKPLSCRSRSAIPAVLSANESSPLLLLRGFYYQQFMQFVETATLAEAGLAQRLSEDNRSPEGNVAGSVPLPDAFDQASTSLFGVYDSAIVQSASGFAVVNAAYSQALNCASRSADPVAAEAEVGLQCLSERSLTILSSGMMFVILYVRLRRLIDLADAQTLAADPLQTPADMVRLGRLRAGASALSSLRDVVLFMIPTVLLVVIFVVLTTAGASHACEDSLLVKMLTLAAFALPLPDLAARGLFRLASRHEVLGFRVEAWLTAVLLLLAFGLRIISRTILFRFVIASGAMAGIVCGLVVLVTLALPAHWAAYDVWRDPMHRFTNSDAAVGAWALAVERSTGLQVGPLAREGAAVKPRYGDAPGAKPDPGQPAAEAAATHLSATSRRESGSLRFGGGTSAGPLADDESDDSEGVGVEEVLRTAGAREVFVQHLRQEFCVESALFVLECWRLEDEDAVHDADAEGAAGLIWDRFVRPGSEMWVNLSSRAVRSVSRSLRELNELGLQIEKAPGYDPSKDTGHAYVKTRWWFLALLQCLAGYLFAMGGRQIHQATVAACYVGHVEGTGAALNAVVRSLQLPWDETSTVDRCASEAVLDETLGPGWTTEVRPDSPGPLTWATDTGVHLDQPLSCRSRSAVPALLYSKERQALGPTLSGAHLIGMSGVQSPTLAEAGLAQRLSEDNRSPEGNVAGSVPLPDAFDQASTSLFGVYDSAIVQSASGYVAVGASYSQALNCASRSADPAAAEAEVGLQCLSERSLTILSSGMMFVILYVRLRRLIDLADAQTLAADPLQTPADMVRLGRLRAGASALSSLRDVVLFMIPTVLLTMLFTARSLMGPNGSCGDDVLAQMFPLAAVCLSLPDLAARGLFRLASRHEVLGFRIEAWLTAVLLLVEYSGALLSRSLLFSFELGSVAVSGAACAGVILVTLALPAHWAAYDVWRDPMHRFTNSDAAVGAWALAVERSTGLQVGPLAREGAAVKPRYGDAPGAQPDPGQPAAEAAATHLSATSRRESGSLRFGGGTSAGPLADDESDDSEGVGVEEVLRTAGAREVFVQHLRQEFCVESALFVLECWRLEDEDAVHDADAEGAAGLIWDRFVRPGSEMWVNLSSRAVRSVSRSLRELNELGLQIEKAPGFLASALLRRVRTVFRPAVKEVLSSLDRDNFARFRRTTGMAKALQVVLHSRDQPSAATR
ncbi:hypothetical protein FNF27_07720 [Cafeteria roenbergensis]|uniref:RGS domain-containing protein n=1 Tax=Cafeteria roenbergensis TaxID=33653 RepID=A0A5A8DI49_CAFRO|nr:hypothetical protein FNF27_07720 [Cafeteria roenbergensis]